MGIGSIMTIAAGGMAARQTQLAATASNVANSSTPAYRRLDTRFAALDGGGVEAIVSAAPSGSEDLATDMLDMVDARIGFAANAAVFETGATIWDMLLQIKRD